MQLIQGHSLYYQVQVNAYLWSNFGSYIYKKYNVTKSRSLRKDKRAGYRGEDGHVARLPVPRRESYFSVPRPNDRTDRPTDSPVAGNRGRGLNSEKGGENVLKYSHSRTCKAPCSPSSEDLAPSQRQSNFLFSL